MSKPEIVEEFLVGELGVGGPGLDHDEDLLSSDLLDSQGIVNLVAFLEERFGIEIGDEDLVPDNFRSVSSIVAFTTSKGA